MADQKRLPIRVLIADDEADIRDAYRRHGLLQFQSPAGGARLQSGRRYFKPFPVDR